MRRFLLILLVCSLILLESSCVGLRQINELAIVTAVGIDSGNKPGTVKLSAQIIRPADARGQTGAPAGGTGQPIYSISAEGNTIFDAIRNLGRFSSRRVYWAHNFLIVMSESYARQGIRDMVDFFTRNHELRMNTWVAVTSDKPDELISTITGIEVVPGEAVDKLFRNNQIVGLAPGSNMMNLEEALLSSSAEPVVARLQLQPRGISNKKPEEHGSLKQVELAGAAVFRDDKMLGWLTPKETRVSLFFLERLESGIEVIDCPNDDNRRLTLEFKNAHMTVKPFYENKTPRYHIRLKTTADIVESGCNIPVEQLREAAEASLEKLMKQRIQNVLDKAQKQYHSDFLKLGDVFRNKYPREWKRVGKDWEQLFAGAKFEIETYVDIKSAVVKAAGDGIK
ncbi:Ger(x)C family spore germination protein [Paenibacillus sp. MMO-177]|uniref:Ger(x)C family spore germination protein n=1 Tax=Paenibacillus sp. MMO-177 TaxID=3081289 RepID=UPI003016E047